MSETKHKIISIAIATLGSLLGFEALSLALRLYQLETFYWIALVIYAFHVFWLTFIFDLHLKSRGNITAGRLLNLKGLRLFGHALKNRLSHLSRWGDFRHCINYLILPGLLYWGTAVILMLNPFRSLLKQSIIVLTTAAIVSAYTYYKRVFDKKMEHHEDGLKILNLSKIYCAFLCLSAVFGLTVYFGLPPDFLAISLGFLTFLLAYQALFQHDLVTPVTVMGMVASALFVALAGSVLYRVWDTNYFTAGLFLATCYNFCWGLLHHYADKNLTKKLAVEYFVMSLFVATMLIATHDFRIRIG